MNDWVGCMRRGDLAAAWRIADAVLHARAGTSSSHLPRHEQWIWDGTPIAGRRVLVRCYHGLGDTLQFIRYAPLLRAAAARVVVWAQPELLPLLATVRGIDELLPLHDGTPEAAYDVDVEIMELPHLFRTTLATLPADVPYLHVDGVAPRPADGRLHVGLVWAAGGWDGRRSLSHGALAPLAALPDVVWHVLQRGEALAGREPPFGVPARTETVLDTARAVRALDLVVTVDSMPAHLAGALAVPVWTLLHADPDWRWMDGDRSPWYPTMRLFRQPAPGDWDAVVARVADELRAMMAARGGSGRR